MTKKTIKKERKVAKTLKEKVDLMYSCFRSEEHLSHIAKERALKEGDLVDALEYDHCNRTMSWVLESMDYILEHGQIQ